MIVSLALIAAVLFGVGDFFGGSASRKAPVIGVLLMSSSISLLPPFALTLVVHSRLSLAAVLWGAVAGISGGMGVLLLFRGLATAAMSVVAPLTAVMSALVPVVIGIATGERPSLSAFVGMVLALAAVALVSRGEEHGAGDTTVRAVSTSGVLLALLAGTCFGLYFVLLKHAPDDSGIWPVAVGRASALAVFIAIGLATTAGFALPRGRARGMALLSGTFDVIANVLYLFAVRGGPLSLVGVIVALYPASTVLLARVVFAERLARPQLVGLGCAAVGVGLMAAG